MCILMNSGEFPLSGFSRLNTNMDINVMCLGERKTVPFMRNWDGELWLFITVLN